MAVEVFRGVRNLLGEGPAWLSGTSTLLWVDIRGGSVFSAPLSGGASTIWRVVERPSAVIPTADGRLLVPSGRTIFSLSPATGGVTRFVCLEGEPRRNRCNDAKCDPQGNLWVGTMDENEHERSGRLWRFGPDQSGSVMLDGIGIPNTLAWDMRRRRFYFADSALGEIYVFDYDADRADIGERQTFFANGVAPGIPDGSAIDEDGYLWNARWDGGAVIRISPEGRLDRVVELPCDRPTSCAFGGADMRTLFVTSAVRDEAESTGLDGAVFSIRVDVPGTRVPAYTGTRQHDNRNEQP